MSMEGTLRMTKGEKMAMEMAHQLGGIAVRSGTGGMTLVTKAEAARRTLIDAARAELDAAEKPAAEVATAPAVAPQEFTEINYQGNLRGTDFMWGVHAAGCADISKEVQRQFGSKAKDKTEYLLTNHTAASMRELLDAIVDGETRELGWGDDNVKVHNCVKFAKAPKLSVVKAAAKAARTVTPEEQVEAAAKVAAFVDESLAKGTITEATAAVLKKQPKAKKATGIIAQANGITAVSGVAPGKGQLPAGLVAYLAKRAADKAAGIKPAKAAKAPKATTAVAAGASERASKRIAVCPHCGQPIK